MAQTDKPFHQQAAIEGDLVVWRVSGVVDDDRIDELKIELSRLLQLDRREVIVDFAGLQAITSRGLGFLITLQKEIRSRGGRLALVNLGARFAPLFELTRLNRIFEIFLDMETAKRSYGIGRKEKT